MEKLEAEAKQNMKLTVKDLTSLIREFDGESIEFYPKWRANVVKWTESIDKDVREAIIISKLKGKAAAHAESSPSETGILEQTSR